jgi:hypothetical protein
MDQTGKEGVLATISRNQAHWTVRLDSLYLPDLSLTCFSHIDAEQYRVALTMTETLLKELKQLDDKIILTEVFLLESRAAHAIQNLPRAKVSSFSPSSDTQIIIETDDSGCSYICTNNSQLDLLPTTPPGLA